MNVSEKYFFFGISEVLNSDLILLDVSYVRMT
jgi:hypothetical protein